MLVSFCLCVANEVYLAFIWCLLIWINTWCVVFIAEDVCIWLQFMYCRECWKHWKFTLHMNLLIYMWLVRVVLFWIYRCICKVNMFLFILLTGCSSWFGQSLALPTLTLLSALRMTKVRKSRDPRSDIILVFNSGHDRGWLYEGLPSRAITFVRRVSMWSVVAGRCSAAWVVLTSKLDSVCVFWIGLIVFNPDMTFMFDWIWKSCNYSLPDSVLDSLLESMLHAVLDSVLYFAWISSEFVLDPVLKPFLI